MNLASRWLTWRSVTRRQRSSFSHAPRSGAMQPKEEVLLLGWGVPIPLPVRSRRYDGKFWQDLGVKGGGKKGEKEIKEELGF